MRQGLEMWRTIGRPKGRPTRNRAAERRPSEDGTCIDHRERWCCVALAIGISVVTLHCESGGTRATHPSNQNPQTTPVDVLVVSPVRQDLTRSIILPVSVAAYETATLLSRVTGYLDRIEVDIGDRVVSGQVVAQIDVPELLDRAREAEAELAARKADLATAKAERDRALADLELKRVTYQRIKSVRDEEPDVMALQELDDARAYLDLAEATTGISAGRIEQAESAIAQSPASIKRLQTLIGFAEIRAPFDGIVTERHVDPGMLLQAETSSRTVQRIVTIASVARVRLEIDVPEAEVPLVQTGDAVAITLDSLPGRSFDGTVTRFAGVVDSSTRTMRTEIDLENPKGTLRPGMYGRATLRLDTKAQAITIPADALRVQGNAQQFVYCVVDGHARRRDVRTAVGDGSTVEVAEGLDGTEAVVLSARGPIADGVPVSAAVRASEVAQ